MKKTVYSLIFFSFFAISFMSCKKDETNKDDSSKGSIVLLKNDGFIADGSIVYSGAENDFLIQLTKENDVMPDSLRLVISNQSTDNDDSLSMMLGAPNGILSDEIKSLDTAVKWFRVFIPQTLGDHSNVPAQIISYSEGKPLHTIRFNIRTDDNPDAGMYPLQFTSTFYDYKNTLKPTSNNSAPYLGVDDLRLSDGDDFYIAFRANSNSVFTDIAYLFHDIDDMQIMVGEVITSNASKKSGAIIFPNSVTVDEGKSVNDTVSYYIIQPDLPIGSDEYKFKVTLQ